MRQHKQLHLMVCTWSDQLPEASAGCSAAQRWVVERSFAWTTVSAVWLAITTLAGDPGRASLVGFRCAHASSFCSFNDFYLISSQQTLGNQE